MGDGRRCEPSGNLAGIASGRVRPDGRWPAGRGCRAFAGNHRARRGLPGQHGAGASRQTAAGTAWSASGAGHDREGVSGLLPLSLVGRTLCGEELASGAGRPVHAQPVAATAGAGHRRCGAGRTRSGVQARCQPLLQAAQAGEFGYLHAGAAHRKLFPGADRARPAPAAALGDAAVVHPARWQRRRAPAVAAGRAARPATRCARPASGHVARSP